MQRGGNDQLTECALRLDEAGVPYMVTGSVAAYFYGLNRATGDTDVVIDIKPHQADAFIETFQGAYFVDPIMVRESIRDREMFNLMPRAGGKFDFIPLRSTPSEQRKFARRRPVDWHDYPLWIATALDLVLSKLEWARTSYSAMQFNDVRTIMASDEFDEDDPYFIAQLRALDLEAVLDAARAARHDA